MFLQSRILCLYAESAIHAGMGSGLGAVDLPIQRERTTLYPIIQASGVKGALRRHAPWTDEAEAVFGPFERPDHAGALSPCDARLLLFPVRALRGVFVWTTSTDVLWRFHKDALYAGYQSVPEAVPPEPGPDSAWVSGKDLLLDRRNILLEEFSFNAQYEECTCAWAEYLADFALPGMLPGTFWADRLKKGLVVLPIDDFRDFVRYATEIVTRIKVSPSTKTVAEGALFSQELLPSDSLMYIPLHASRLRRDNASLAADTPEREAFNVMSWARDNIRPWIQIGGDETVGRGLARLRWLEE